MLRVSLCVLLCVALAALSTTACTADPDPDSTPDAADSWTDADEARAVQEAEQAIHAYWHVSTGCLADPPSSDPSCFDEVSYGAKLEADTTALRIAQEDGLRYVGEPTYQSTEKVEGVELSGGQDKEVRLSGCWSIDGYDIVRPDGTSVIPADVPRRTRSIFVVRQHEGAWRVADMFFDPKGVEC